jgi:flagellar biosynthesis protein FliR
MELTVDMLWVLTVLLVALRIATIFVLTPLFALGGLPGRIRLLFVLVMSVSLVSALAVPPPVAIHGLGGLVTAAVGEVLFGALLAFGLFTAFATFQLAGRMLDLQMGFGVASLIDPATRAQSPLLGTLLNLIAVAVFFAVDGHLMLIRGLAFSIEHLPPGGSFAAVDTGAVVAQFGGMFVYALALAAPVLIVLFLVDVAMAVMARTMPQLNVFIVSMPLKIMVGLFVLVVSIRFMGPLMARIFEQLFFYWQGLMS